MNAPFDVTLTFPAPVTGLEVAAIAVTNGTVTTLSGSSESLLYGQTDNDISPLGSYKDSFDTDRYLAQLRVTGLHSYGMMTLMPLLDFTHTQDTQQDYTDTLGNLIDEQGVDLTQVTFGVDFRHPMAVRTGQLDLTAGLSGTYSETKGGRNRF